MPHIVVHHLEKSRSHRVLWALEELGLAYELKTYKRDPITIRAPEELRRVHPLGKAPALEIDGKVYAESGAILDHLAETFGDDALRPMAGSDDARRYRYWLHYAEGSLMSPLLVRLIMSKVETAPVPFFVKPIARGIVKKVEGSFTRPELERHATFIEEHLTAHPFFAGEAFSAADIQMSYPVLALVDRGKVTASQPKTRAWLETMQSRPAHTRALEQGGPVLL